MLHRWFASLQSPHMRVERGRMPPVAEHELRRGEAVRLRTVPELQNGGHHPHPIIQLMFGGTRGLRVPPLVKAHHRLAQLVPMVPCRCLLKHLQDVPELDVREEFMWMEIPADRGLEVNQ